MRTFIFDFDGTIADTLDLVIEIGNELLVELGRPQMTKSDIKKLRGMAIPEIIKYLGVPKHLLPQLAIKGRARLTAKAKHVKPVPGMVEVLRQLHERGERLGIISSNSKETVLTFLRAHQLEEAFEFIDGGVSLFGKSRRLKASVRKHKLVRTQTLYVGDEVRDIEGAKTAGVTIVSVGWGLNNEQALAAAKPDHLIQKPRQLLELS